jgi:hypothetical protein
VVAPGWIDFYNSEDGEVPPGWQIVRERAFCPRHEVAVIVLCDGKPV